MLDLHSISQSVSKAALSYPIKKAIRPLATEFLRYWACVAAGMLILCLLEGGWDLLFLPHIWIICLFGMCVYLDLAYKDIKGDK